MGKRMGRTVQSSTWKSWINQSKMLISKRNQWKYQFLSWENFASDHIFLRRYAFYGRRVFCGTISKNSQKYMRFQWKGNLYEFLYLCTIFKVQEYLQNQWKYQFLSWENFASDQIYLDDMLFYWSPTVKELLMTWDTLIYLLQSLSFLINIPKSLLNLTSTL